MVFYNGWIFAWSESGVNGDDMRGVKLVQVAVIQGHDRQVESGRPDGPNIVHGGGYQLSQAVAALGSWSLGYLRW